MGNKKVWRLFWFAYFCFLVVWSFCVYARIFSNFARTDFFAYYDGKNQVILDFPLWYNAARLGAQASNNLVNIYDPAVQSAGLEDLLKPFKPIIVQYVQYPPQFFALMKPFSYVSMELSYIIYVGLAVVLIAVGLYYLSKLLKSGRFTRIFFVVAALSNYPTWLAIWYGQTALYQFVANIGFWLFLRARKYFIAGLISGMLLIKIQYAPSLIIVGIVLGGVQYILGLLLISVMLASYTVATVGWHNIIAYPKGLSLEISSQVGGVIPEIMQNVRGQLLLFFPSSIVHIISLAAFVLGIFVVFITWHFLYPRLAKAIGETASFSLCAPLTIILTLITSPHTHYHAYIDIAIAAAFLYPVLKAHTLKVPTTKLLLVLLYAFPAISWLPLMAPFFFGKIRIQLLFVWAVFTLSLVVLQIAYQIVSSRIQAIKTYLPESESS